MNELLDSAVSAREGLEYWKPVQSIDVSLTNSGQLFEVRRLPEHLHTKVTIEADQPRTVMEFDNKDGARGIYTPGRVRIEPREQRCTTEAHELNDRCARRFSLALPYDPKNFDGLVLLTGWCSGHRPAQR